MGVFSFYYPNSSLLAILYQASSATAARHSTSFHRSPLPFRGCLSFRAFLTSVCSVYSVVACLPRFLPRDSRGLTIAMTNSCD